LEARGFINSKPLSAWNAQKPGQNRLGKSAKQRKEEREKRKEKEDLEPGGFGLYFPLLLL
jgi:hypothetical protein